VDVSSTAYNITFDDTTLYGGRSELLMGETVHVDNYRRTITTDQPNISRYNVHNGQFLSLKAGSINTITINGNCNVKFKYTWRFLKE
jgi:phage-related protein